jgi:putative ABC transport system substrate-binding protein
MDRRRFLVTSLAGGLVAPLVAGAQKAARNRVGIFAPGMSDGSDQAQQLVKAFREGLAEQGWLEAQNVVIETRWGEGRIEAFPKILSELIALPVDVIVTWGPQAVRAAQQSTTTVPIVMAIVHEPVAFGFVKSLGRPGGNMTGLAFQDSELGTKRLELLKAAVPSMRRVAFLWDHGGGGETGVGSVATVAPRLGLASQILKVERPEDLGPAFASAKRDGAHAVFQIASPFLASQRMRLIELAAAHRLPMTCETGLFVVAGCLMAYGPDFIDMSRRAAVYVDRVLRGAKPAELPIEQPTKFELVINLKTAKALGLTIPPALLGRADRVIE